MGVLSGKDIFSSKWITAIIVDKGNRGYIIPIKAVIDNYFLAIINKEVYAFEIDGSRMITWRATAVRSFRFLMYHTEHYKPISGGDTKALSDVLNKSKLPRVNNILYSLFHHLGKGEKEGLDFTPHDIAALAKKLDEHAEKYEEEILNIKRFIENLGTDKIITPVKRISEFIYDDLIAPDAKFLGSIFSTYQNLDTEHKKVTNTPIGGKIAWMKIILIITLIGGGIGVGVWVYQSGILSQGISLPGFGGQSDEQLMKKYPTPEALKAAVDRGEVNYDKLSTNMKKMVDTAKLPTFN